MAVALNVDVGNPSRSWSQDSHLPPRGHGLRSRTARIGRGAVRSLAIASLALATWLPASDAAAMGLGAATVRSAIGEPLRMSFPVSLQADEEVGCVQVRPQGNDLPAVTNTRVAVIRNGFQARIEVRSIVPVDEPVVGLVVTVGCASPVTREYVVLLDPPIAPPIREAVSEGVPPLSPPPRVERTVERTAPMRRTPRATAADAPPVARAPSSTPAARVPARRPTVRPTSPDLPLASAAPTATPPAPVAVPSPVAKAGDRLTIAPPESAPAVPVTPAPVAVSPAVVPPVAPPMTTTAVNPALPVNASTTPVAPADPSLAAPSPASADAAAVAAREQAMRKQQVELQNRVQTLSDQLAAMKLQSATVATQTRTLEQSGFPSWLLWLLVLLAVFAVLVAGWMTMRYAQLRRSVDGGAWWTSGNTIHAKVDGDTSMAAESRGGLVALDPGTRLAPRPATQTDVRSSATMAPQAAVVSNVERTRPVARDARESRDSHYPAAIDTDFTVSDIEAAMATVRTVSPPRDAPRPQALSDSDFAPLGGPTMPSPFTAPPPPPPVPHQGHGAAQPADSIGQFVNLEIPALPPSTRLGPITPVDHPGALRSSAPAAPKRPPPEEEAEPLDFKLDIPNTFDPLATDTMATTVIEPREPRGEAKVERPASMSSLDFELPAAIDVKPLTASEIDTYTDEPPMRHGATALNDLFASGTGMGVDTILDLDDRDGAPLSSTDFERLTTTSIQGPNGELLPPSTRMVMARFADLMNQVDEMEIADPLRAIALLRQYVLRDESIPTLLWLRLFELYRKVDKQPVYDALAEHFQRRYHRPMVGWTESLADRAPQSPLSAMPVIDREIEAKWGTEEGLEVVRALLCDRDQPDAVVFDAVLQRDLLDAAKVFPSGPGTLAGNRGADAPGF